MELVTNAMIAKILMLTYASGALKMLPLYMKEIILSELLKMISTEASGYYFRIEYHSFLYCLGYYCTYCPSG